MKALIESEADGVLCPLKCEALIGWNYGAVHRCMAPSLGAPRLEYAKNGIKRHPKCLEATARAQELLDAEAELKRMKDAETYENERMP